MGLRGSPDYENGSAGAAWITIQLRANLFRLHTIAERPGDGHASTHTHTRAHTHPHTTHTHARARTHTRTYTHTHAREHTHATHTHTRTCGAHTHTLMRARFELFHSTRLTHTPHTRAHTHTHSGKRKASGDLASIQMMRILLWFAWRTHTVSLRNFYTQIRRLPEAGNEKGSKLRLSSSNVLFVNF